MVVQYGSAAVRDFAKAKGYDRVFADAGVEVIQPGCGACIGCGPGVSERAEQVTVSAINRNFQGRSGPGKLYLASPLYMMQVYDRVLLTGGLTTLAFISVVLLLALVVVTLAPGQVAQAQGFAAQGYIMVAGEAKNVPQGRKVIYITEISSARMVAVIFNSTNDEFEWVAGRELAQDLKLRDLKGKK